MHTWLHLSHNCTILQSVPDSVLADESTKNLFEILQSKWHCTVGSTLDLLRSPMACFRAGVSWVRDVASLQWIAFTSFASLRSSCLSIKHRWFCFRKSQLLALEFLFHLVSVRNRWTKMLLPSWSYAINIRTSIVLNWAAFTMKHGMM